MDTKTEIETPEINLITRYQANEKGLAKWAVCHIVPEDAYAFDQEIHIIIPAHTGNLFAQRMRTELSRLRDKVRTKIGRPAKVWRLNISIKSNGERDLLIVSKHKNKASIAQEVEKALEDLAV